MYREHRNKSHKDYVTVSMTTGKHGVKCLQYLRFWHIWCCRRQIYIRLGMRTVRLHTRRRLHSDSLSGIRPPRCALSTFNKGNQNNMLLYTFYRYLTMKKTESTVVPLIILAYRIPHFVNQRFLHFSF